METLRLDGNAAAGLLRDVFAAEATTAVGTCDHCGSIEAVGAIHVYLAAGTVLRCPHCDSVVMKVVTDGDRIWIDFRGLRTLELGPEPPSS
jgi:Zn finger protein HypA/HybF involved in hydrogenase expression